MSEKDKFSDIHDPKLGLRLSNKAKDSGAHYVDLHVGTKLREKRREKGISQDELAKAVDLTFQQVQKYEKGLNRISCSKLHDFAKYLKTDIRYFFQGLDEVFYPFVEGCTTYSFGEGNFSNVDSNTEIAELVKAFQMIKDPKIRHSIINLTISISYQS